MPYRRPYRARPRRSRPYRRRVAASRRPTARRVQSLERRVTSLAKHDKVWGTYRFTQGLNLSSPYYTVNLMDPNNWGACFGNPDIVENTNQFNLNSITLKMSITPGNEAGLIDMTIFIISAQKENARKVVHETGGATNLTSTLDYIQDSYGTGTMLNLSRWKVHAMRKVYTRITMGTQEPAIPSPTRRLTFRIPWKVPMKSGTGNWKNTITSVDDVNSHRQLFLLAFNNNSGLNLGYPALYFNALYSGYAIA